MRQFAQQWKKNLENVETVELLFWQTPILEHPVSFKNLHCNYGTDISKDTSIQKMAAGGKQYELIYFLKDSSFFFSKHIKR